MRDDALQKSAKPDDEKPAESLEQVRERRRQEWEFSEARYGKGWRLRYPHLAGWKGAYSSFRSEGAVQISLMVYPHSAFTGQNCDVGFHTTYYTIFEKSGEASTEEDSLRFYDETIKEWMSEHGSQALDQFEKGWMGESDWEVQYPYISAWIRRGRRHCIRISINFVTGESAVKAWLYDKPTNTETVLVEKELTGLSQSEVLRILDTGIAEWLHFNEGKNLGAAE